MVSEYQVQYYHTIYVLVKVQFQVIEKEEDRLREDREWGVGESGTG